MDHEVWQYGRTWRLLNRHLHGLTEEQVAALLVLEWQGPKRPRHLERLYNRLNKLRAQREREALLRFHVLPYVATKRDMYVGDSDG